MRTLAFFLILSTFLFSCAPNFTEEKKEVDDFNKILDKSDSLFFSIPKEDVYNRLNIYESNLNRIRENAPDSIDMEMSAIVNRCKLIKKPFKHFLGNYEKYRKEVDLSRDQLNNLYHDLEIRVMKKDSFYYYLEMEKEYIVNLSNEMESNAKDVINLIKNFDTLNPLLEVKIKNIENSKKIE